MTTDGWMPIDSAPRDGTRVDLWVDGERVTDCLWQDGCWLTKEDGCWWSVSEGSHWRSIPPPPVEK